VVAQFRIEGANKFRAAARRLKRLNKKLPDFRPAWKTMLPVMLDGLGRAITSEGSSIGADWPPLSKSYRRRKKGPGILQESGKSLRFLRSKKAKIKLNKKVVAAGPKGKIRHMFVHLAGAKKSGIPARKFIGWDNLMLADARRILKQKLRDDIVKTKT
jgi:hypothetical protein